MNIDQPLYNVYGKSNKNSMTFQLPTNKTQNVTFKNMYLAYYIVTSYFCLDFRIHFIVY